MSGELFRPIFVPDEIREAVSGRAWLEAMLDAERALAVAQARTETRDGSSLNEGPIIHKGIVPMRSFVCEPMQYGRLFLAGDAAHIVTPTGAKGMNLAVRDVQNVADALTTWYETGSTDLLRSYPDTCLCQAWKAQCVSWCMTSLLHSFPDNEGFRYNLQLVGLDYGSSPQAGATSVAENYLGLAFEE